MGRTSDARKGIAFPSHQGGAGRAHVEGEWLGRMFRAGRHGGYMPWSPEGRGPESGALYLAGGPLPAPSEFGQNFVDGFGKPGSSLREVVWPLELQTFF